MFTAAQVASAGGAETSPDGVPATQCSLVLPTGVAFDAAGNMYISEAGTIHVGTMPALGGDGGIGQTITDALGLPRAAGRIRKVTPDGKITTVAGRGSRFFPDDGGDNALILPMALTIAPDGRMAIADLGANIIRILPAGSYYS